MQKPRSRKSLLEALERASKVPLTQEQISKQRVSFIMGSLNKDSGVTRAQVEEVLAQQEGRRAA